MQGDRIRWINHAGFELQSQGLRIVCDPWLTGLAFSKSWALISETKYMPQDFDGVNYIWFSHEHPDHFSPSDITSIPESIRKTITVLFRKTKDGRVAKFCQYFGFLVREIGDLEREALGNNVFITVKTVDDDSLCLIETPHNTYLNVNDCVASDVEALHRYISSKFGRIDVLLTQFSFANWAGNPGDAATVRHYAHEKLQQIETQLAIYKPRTLIPFASFVWFCRPDNFHLNNGANRIADVHNHFKDQVGVVVLYPDDIYQVGTPHDSSSALAAYKADEERHKAPLSIAERSFAPTELEDMCETRQRKMNSKNWMWLFWPLHWLGYIKPVNIFLTDHGRSLKYSVLTGITWTDVARKNTDVEFRSAAMAQLLRHGSGYDTLIISGRLIEHKSGSRFALSRNSAVMRMNEHGQFFPAMFFNLNFIRAKLPIKRGRDP